MPRLKPIPDADLSPEQALVCAEARSGPRGKIPAPMIAWLRNPELARRGQKLGELLRFETSLEPRLTELAILVCGRHWTSHHEWTAHKALALKAGLEAGVIADIAARRSPNLQCDRQRAVYEVSSALLANGRIGEDLYESGTAQLGEKGMVELVSVLGYYCLVALTLNAFELGIPENVAPELQDPQFPGSPQAA
ncbi:MULTISPECIES: carboxymuconolactone decarboxylase family protein [Gammaproteobacteria]|uniref:carboxymuconolactone decarboxylase family protein n=1 Tax=Gammaproteobacteria TaxID=1236 RepID=UPI0017852397|nr:MULTISPECIES: carboxymuconolactone decarboxylase family protein [Gammaproteobacteria]MBD9368004.1 carboxymuconolactone decarboxylase family protein [Xanthomonas sp. XNM01]MBH3343799.1 carboxymuconolactone decarboxylase family protein [Pseudomonas parafulva]